MTFVDVLTFELEEHLGETAYNSILPDLSFHGRTATIFTEDADISSRIQSLAKGYSVGVYYSAGTYRLTIGWAADSRRGA